MDCFAILFFSFFVFNAITLSLSDDSGQDEENEDDSLIIVLTTPFSLVDEYRCFLLAQPYNDENDNQTRIYV